MNFSNLESINLNWLRVLAVGLGSVSIIVWIVHIISNLNIIDHNVSRDFWIFLSVTIFVFIAGYFGFRQGVIYKFEPNEEKSQGVVAVNDSAYSKKAGKIVLENKKYEKSQLSKKDAERIIEKLGRYMVDEKAYTNCDLSLEEVAQNIGITSHTLSQILNVFIQKNFFNYVNEYRVERVKNMLTDQTYNNLSLVGIALEAGFNSKSSFNRIFKKTTGMTPTDFKNKNSGI
jgi:AraC-like DNA-binding protein